MNDLMTSSKINIIPTENSKLHEIDFDNLVFGKKFSDHMFVMEYDNGAWSKPEIRPYGPIQISPALNTLHYGQAIFEGMKAFYVDEETINLYRPKDHFERLNRSARRIGIPETDYDTFISGLEELIRLDHQFVPKKEQTSLYIRPFIFASDDLLAARSSSKFSYYIITSPVGAYYEEGFNPVSLTTTENYVRAVVGGTGEVKTAGNYAASFLPAQEAKNAGYTQVLWLDAKEHKYIEEVGTMNIHFLIGDTLVTPELTGSILGGITRRSVIEVASEWGYKIEERKISIDEVFKASKDGSLKEVFGSGTAAVISPVGKIHHQGEVINIGTGKIGEFAERLYNEITGIQYGKIEDKHDWIHSVKV
ncbi:MAG: branched-chain amino acid aminotransferase [Balneola sp.]